MLCTDAAQSVAAPDLPCGQYLVSANLSGLSCSSEIQVFAFFVPLSSCPCTVIALKLYHTSILPRLTDEFIPAHRPNIAV